MADCYFLVRISIFNQQLFSWDYSTEQWQVFQKADWSLTNRVTQSANKFNLQLAPMYTKREQRCETATSIAKTECTNRSRWQSLFLQIIYTMPPSMWTIYATILSTVQLRLALEIIKQLHISCVLSANQILWSLISTAYSLSKQSRGMLWVGLLSNTHLLGASDSLGPPQFR